MTQQFKFDNVYCKGRHETVNTEADNLDDAKKKAVNFLIKKYKMPKEDFATQLHYLNTNLSNGDTTVTKMAIPSQTKLELGDSSSTAMGYVESLKAEDGII